MSSVMVLGEIAYGDTVLIQENGTYVEYILVPETSTRCMLLRKYPIDLDDVDG